MALIDRILQNSLFRSGVDPGLLSEVAKRRGGFEGSAFPGDVEAAPGGSINQLGNFLQRARNFGQFVRRSSPTQPLPAGAITPGVTSVRAPGVAGSTLAGPPEPSVAQQAAGPVFAAAAIADFASNVRESQDRRGGITTRNRHQAAAGRAINTARDAVFENVLGDVGIPERSVSTVAAQFFNTVPGEKFNFNEKKLRSIGFNDKEALSNLIFKGSHTVSTKSPLRRGKPLSRTITLDQFLQHASPAMHDRISAFRSSDSFSQADSDFSNINNIVEGFEAGENPGKPDIVVTFIENPFEELKRRSSFG